jgi:heme exporter protein D
MKFDHGTNAAVSLGATSRRDARISTRFPTRSGKKFDLSNVKEFKLQDLAMLSISPIVRSIQHWWLQRAERHYLICADVEQQRAREAQMNVAYYQKRAALARSARN